MVCYWNEKEEKLSFKYKGIWIVVDENEYTDSIHEPLWKDIKQTPFPLTENCIHHDFDVDKYVENSKGLSHDGRAYIDDNLCISYSIFNDNVRMEKLRFDAHIFWIFYEFYLGKKSNDLLKDLKDIPSQVLDKLDREYEIINKNTKQSLINIKDLKLKRLVAESNKLKE
jgi:hypothetical protein